MGDTAEGSSIAAQRAQVDEIDTSHSRVGFFKRVFGKDSQPTSENTDKPVDVIEQNIVGTREMLLNVRNMHDLRVEDVAIPIADITAISDDTTLDELVETFRQSGYSRLPVYSETLDNPLGLVHLKDLALRHGFGGDKKFDLTKIIRPLIYAPPSMPLGALMQRMQNERTHMALVIDEYGGVDGLVTIENLIEEIVGEIADEHDTEETQLWIEEGNSVFLAQARAPLEEFEQAASVDLLSDDLDEDVDTLGGLVFMLSGRVPSRGECIKDSHGHEYEVVDADARSIKRLRVRINRAAVIEQAAE